MRLYPLRRHSLLLQRFVIIVIARSCVNLLTAKRRVVTAAQHGSVNLAHGLGGELFAPPVRNSGHPISPLSADGVDNLQLNELVAKSSSRMTGLRGETDIVGVEIFLVQYLNVLPADFTNQNSR